MGWLILVVAAGLTLSWLGLRAYRTPASHFGASECTFTGIKAKTSTLKIGVKGVVFITQDWLVLRKYWWSVGAQALASQGEDLHYRLSEIRELKLTENEVSFRDGDRISTFSAGSRDLEPLFQQIMRAID